MLKYIINMQRDISSTANTSAPPATATLLPSTNRCICFNFQTVHGQGELYDSSVTFYFVWESKKTKNAVATRLIKHKVMKMYLNHTLLECFSMTLCSSYVIGCSAHDNVQYKSKITTQSVSSINVTCLRTSEKYKSIVGLLWLNTSCHQAAVSPL